MNGQLVGVWSDQLLSEERKDMITVFASKWKLNCGQLVKFGVVSSLIWSVKNDSCEYCVCMVIETVVSRSRPVVVSKFR